MTKGTPLDVAISGGTVATGTQTFDATVGIRDGRIAAFYGPEEEITALQTIDAAGRLVLPGFVDAHVHMREPGPVHKEGFETGTMAAAAGGVTTVMAMPTTDPPTLTPTDFEDKVRLAETKAYVDFALQAGVGEDLSFIAELARMGAASFEIFLADIFPALAMGDSGHFSEALGRIAEVGGIAGITPGDEGIIRQRTARADGEGVHKPLAFARTRPPVSEALGVARACILAGETGTRIHIRQVSCQASVAVLRDARSHSDRLSGEVTPHNLLLTEADLERHGPFAKMVPPLRQPSDLESLWDALLDGTIDIVATDHAPHLPAEKEPGKQDIWKAPGGIPGLQTFPPLMLDQVAKGRMTLAELVRTCCEQPARLFGLYPRKGALLPGSDADLVIVDSDRERAIENAEQLSKAANTPFAGQVVKGWPVLTMVRGRVVMRDGIIEGSPAGTFVKPEKRE